MPVRIGRCRTRVACYRRGVLPQDIKKLREELECSTRELADTLKTEQLTVMAWEKGELFPTKRFVKQMELLRKQGPGSIVRIRRGRSKQKTGMARLDDPKLWEVVRKLVEHPGLFDQVAKLADGFEDPAHPEKADDN